MYSKPSPKSNPYGPKILNWQSSTPLADLPAGAIHLWKIDLADPRAFEHALPQLSLQEKDRVARFHHAGARSAFVITRAAKRLILSAYLGIHPKQLVLAKGETGKPYVGEPAGDLRFNLTHSADLALLAVCRGADIGLDLEYLKRSKTPGSIAARMFSAEAAQEVADAMGNEKIRCFFYHWTRMEAAVKADGTGLAGVHQARPAGIWLHSFVPAPGYQACIAGIGGRSAPEQWQALEFSWAAEP